MGESFPRTGDLLVLLLAVEGVTVDVAGEVVVVVEDEAVTAGVEMMEV